MQSFSRLYRWRRRRQTGHDAVGVRMCFGGVSILRIHSLVTHWHFYRWVYLRHKQGAGVDDVYEVSQTTEEGTLEKTKLTVSVSGHDNNTWPASALWSFLYIDQCPLHYSHSQMSYWDDHWIHLHHTTVSGLPRSTIASEEQHNHAVAQEMTHLT